MKASPVKYVCYFRTRVAHAFNNLATTHNRQHQSIKRIHEYYARYTTKYHSNVIKPHD
ncbi:hypothetical protein K450DRAFT_263954 [Umbelopsis ramanniana AG]|uniref:Uncharacterized protein n=1 Tax=Umbelopsis ramanniana AG TaxID=1314678 RepID=A0AAD5E1U2_UMBRA|nr:uncharacterized protein K450DRAFT_263954 [Umbelopsis ramanniana AG]KAI8574961.1 hypothetical protein K450DRAFT_263954 [Umbelopsis ramanniana AG]